MIWPDNIKIKDAISQENNILDRDIREKYRCIFYGNGRRRKIESASGGFCIVFKMESKFYPNSFACYRLWTVEPSKNMQKRLEIISKGLTHTKLPYFVNFRYMDQSMDVSGTVIPGMFMKWVEGMSLGKFIQAKSEDLANGSISVGVLKREYSRLASDFFQMCRDFKYHGISHGDLSATNIIITPNNKIQLIDYDSVFVPEMGTNYSQTTGGVNGMQHRDRIETSGKIMMASAHDDDFSQYVVYLSLLALSVDPSIGKHCGDQELLFADVSSVSKFCKTSGYLAVSKIAHPEVQFWLKKLYDAISGPLYSVKSIVDSVMPESLSKPAGYCIMCGHNYDGTFESYCPECGEKRLIISL